MILRDVAEDIEMHESTVSRVVSNKYMHTPRGLLPMKFFFHSGITSTMGEAVSSVTIKDRIRKMIEAHQAEAEQTGARIVHACGMDSIPSDVGVFFLQRRAEGYPCAEILLDEDDASLLAQRYHTIRELFERALRARKFPVEISEIRMASDPLTSTARGAHIAAMFEK